MQVQELSTQDCRWLTATQDLSEHTVRAYESDVASLQQFLGPNFSASALTPAVFYAFLEHLTENGRSPATARRRLSGLRSFCGWLAAQEHIDANPVSDLAIRFSRPRRLPRAVSATDLRTLLRHLSAEAELTNGVAGFKTGIAKNTQATTLLAAAGGDISELLASGWVKHWQDSGSGAPLAVNEHVGSHTRLRSGAESIW